MTLNKQKRNYLFLKCGLYIEIFSQRVKSEKDRGSNFTVEKPDDPTLAR